MDKLDYIPQKKELVIPKIQLYKISSMFNDPKVNEMFLSLKANIVDINPALIVKCITGSEADFILLMDRADEFIKSHFSGIEDDTKTRLLLMFKECVFEYYVLTPLLKSPEVSDVKIYSWNKIALKARGVRYVSDISFFSEKDYNDWLSRRLRIQNLPELPEYSLQYHTDRKGIDDFYLRNDVQLKHVVSTENNIIHIRKLPKEKPSWDYLKKEKMLDDQMITYIYDRILSGYSFLISGRGGSGKTTLLNCMIDIIPFNESVLVIQESDELYSEVHPLIQFEHTITVPTKQGEKEFSLEDELRLGLLQDIDRFVIGEIKGGEALNVFTTAMSTGAIFMGTIHSNDCAGSIIRLAQCARYVSDYPMETLFEMVSTIPFCLIHLSHYHINEITEIAGFNQDKKQLIYKTVYKKEGSYEA